MEFDRCFSSNAAETCQISEQSDNKSLGFKTSRHNISSKKYLILKWNPWLDFEGWMAELEQERRSTGA